MTRMADAKASLAARPYKLLDGEAPDRPAAGFRGHSHLARDMDAARAPEPEEDDFAGAFNNLMGALAALDAGSPIGDNAGAPSSGEAAGPTTGEEEAPAVGGNAAPAGGARPAAEGKAKPSVDEYKLRARQEFAVELQAIASRFVAGQPLAQVWADFSYVRGRQEERWKAIEDGAKRSVRLVLDDDGRHAVNLHMELGDGDLTQDQGKLVVEVRRALTVMGVVFAEPDPPATPISRLAERWLGSNTLTPEERRRHDSYVRKLYDIASCGLLSGRGASVALRSLDGLREDFVAREADGVKCQHARMLGGRALSGAVPLLLVYAVVGPVLGLEWANFFLLAAAACLGTWLSFSLRRPTLQFDDLLLQGEDRANPMARVLVVVGLAVAVGLLLETGLVTVMFGSSSLGVDEAGKAILLGLLCGIAEMALAGAIASQAKNVAGRFAGGPPTEVLTVPAPPPGSSSVRAGS